MKKKIFNTGNSLIIHDFKLIESYLQSLLNDPSLENKFSRPTDLIIILISTGHEKTAAEKSLDYLGIGDYTLIKKKLPAGAWRSSFKIQWIEEYLKSHEQEKKKYVLYMDSYDAIIQEDPAAAVSLLKENQCKMLLSSTFFAGGYDCMPDRREWAQSIAPKSAFPFIYLNAGVFIAEWDYLLKVIEKVNDYFTPGDLTREQRVELRAKGLLAEKLRDFPRGIGSDQVILRYLHREFYPEMKIDYTMRLAVRNPSMESLLQKFL